MLVGEIFVCGNFRWEWLPNNYSNLLTSDAEEPKGMFWVLKTYCRSSKPFGLPDWDSLVVSALRMMKMTMLLGTRSTKIPETGGAMVTSLC